MRLVDTPVTPHRNSKETDPGHPDEFQGNRSGVMRRGDRPETEAPQNHHRKDGIMDTGYAHALRLRSTIRRAARCCTTAALALSALLATAAAARAQCDCYKETVIDALPPPASASGPMAMLECDNCDVWLPHAGESKAYYLTATGGASYFDSPTKTSGGGLLGIQGALPILERTGLLANAAVNVYDGGTVYSGGLGAYRNPSYYGSVADRFGGSVVVYQFTDTRLGDPYLVFGTYAINYAVLPGVRAGVKQFDPIHGGDAVLPGGATIGGGQLMTPITEATLSIGSVRQHINLAVGYAHDIESSTYQLNLARPITRRVSTVFDVFYAEQIGYWWGYLGVQIDLSPSDNMQIVSAGRRTNVVRGEYIDPGFEYSSYLSARFVEAGVLDAASDADAPPDVTPFSYARTYIPDVVRGEGGGGGGSPHCDCPAGSTFVMNIAPGYVQCRDNETSETFTHFCDE